MKYVLNRTIRAQIEAVSILGSFFKDRGSDLIQITKELHYCIDEKVMCKFLGKLKNIAVAVYHAILFVETPSITKAFSSSVVVFLNVTLNLGA
jgi:hypothetical protein